MRRRLIRLEGQAWLMHHGYAQAEGVANVDNVRRFATPLHHDAAEGCACAEPVRNGESPAVDGALSAGLGG